MSRQNISLSISNLYISSLNNTFTDQNMYSSEMKNTFLPYKSTFPIPVNSLYISQTAVDLLGSVCLSVTHLHLAFLPALQCKFVLLDQTRASVDSNCRVIVPNISDWIQAWLQPQQFQSTNLFFSPKPSFYPFCCALCVMVLMGNQSSPQTQVSYQVKQVLIYW